MSTELRYVIYESRDGDDPRLYVMPENRVPFANCERCKLGWVSTFSRDGVRAFLSQYTKGKNYKVTYFDYPLEAKV